MKAERHIAEIERLAALRGYEILDTPRETDFDDVVAVAAAICDVPISVINLIDDGRQWFKAEVGLGVRETPLESSICAHAILQPGLLEVPDTTLDKRFIDNDLVTGEPHLRFYAGALLQTPEGLPLGTVCVLDYKPRVLDEKQKAFLRLMASQVMKMLELRRSNAQNYTARIRAEQLVKENETLIQETDHRVMNSLQLVQSVLSLQGRSTTNAEAKAQLETAHNRVLAIATVHQQLHLAGSLDEISIGEFLRRLCESLKLTAPPQVTELAVKADATKLNSKLASSLGLVVAELVTNAFKYAYPSGQSGKVYVDFTSTLKGWRLQVSDNGVGLPKGFDVADSHGVGMRVVSALARRLDADLIAESAPGKTVFSIDSRS